MPQNTNTSPRSKRGPVLKVMTIGEILNFTKGDNNTKIAISQRSLLDAKTARDRALAKAELESI